MDDEVVRDAGSRPRPRPGRALAGVLALLLVMLTALAGCSAAPPAAPARAKGKPNVVMVMTDDQWLESMRVLARTKRVFGEGTTFDEYYPSTPLCCPSRSTHLSGQLPHNNGVRHNSAPQGGYDKLDEKNTLPVWMRRAGYATSHIGKYPNGYGKDDPTAIPPGWDEWRGSVDPSTYWMWGYRLNENGKLRRYGNPRVPDPKLYQTDVYRDKGVDFINRQSRAGNPFFLSLAFLAPHGENSLRKNPGDDAGVGPAPRPAPRHAGTFANEPLPPDPSFGEPDARDKPAFLKEYPVPSDRTREQITKSYRGRLESLLAVDEAVEKLVSTLRQNGQLDNTYLIFASDNGFFFGQHRVPTGKFLPHEASGHVPMMMRGPGIPAGAASRELTSNADLTATIADIGGARPTILTDGRSILPYARDPRLRSGRPVLHEAAAGALRRPVRSGGVHGPAPAADDLSAGQQAAGGDLDQDGSASPPGAPKRPGTPKDHGRGQVLSAAYEAIRTDRYLYIRYVEGGRELYDLATDPAELTSRHADPHYAGVRAYLGKQLDALQGCKGAECHREIPPAPEPM